LGWHSAYFPEPPAVIFQDHLLSILKWFAPPAKYVSGYAGGLLHIEMCVFCLLIISLMNNPCLFCTQSCRHRKVLSDDFIILVNSSDLVAGISLFWANMQTPVLIRSLTINNLSWIFYKVLPSLQWCFMSAKPPFYQIVGTVLTLNALNFRLLCSKAAAMLFFSELYTVILITQHCQFKSQTTIKFSYFNSMLSNIQWWFEEITPTCVWKDSIMLCLHQSVQCEPNIDYVVVNKVLVETLLDAEMKDPTHKGFFYSGNAL